MLPNRHDRPGRRRFRAALIPLIGSSIALGIACSDSAVSPSVHGVGSAVVVGPANDIQIAPSNAALNQGGRALLRCAAFDANGVMLSTPAVWTSSDAGVVAVNGDGTVSAGRAGGANVTCQIGGRSATSAITVSTAHIAMVEVSPGAGILTGGGSLQLSGVPRDSFGIEVPGSSIQWSSADTTIATISAGGVVTAKAAGDADIRAVSAGVVGMTKIKVSPSPLPPVASVTVSVDQSTLSAGSMAHAIATPLDANGQVLTNRAISWSASNPAVISPFTTGANKANVRAIARGTSALIATSEGKSGSVTITVGAPALTSISTTLAAPSIIVGQTTLASAVPLDGLGNPISGGTIAWSSLDPSIATVSSAGMVTGVAPGSVIIRATSGGITGDASLTVSTAPVASVTTTLAASSLTVGQTTQASAVARDASGAPLTGRYVAWSSLNPSIATVSIAGVVTAVAPGSAVIRATIESKTGDATLSVTAATAPSPGPAASVSVTIDSTNLLAGHTSQARFVAKDANGVVLTGKAPAWASQGTTIATVSTVGSVTGMSAGSTRIQATVDGIVGSAPLSVTASTTSQTDSVSLVLDAGSYASGSYAIEATTRLSGVGAVQFLVDGAVRATESIAKYCLFGGDASCASGSLGAGSHTIQAVVLNSVGSAIGRSAVLSIVDGSALAPAPSPAPAPTSGSTAHPNEPAGLSQLASQSMDALSNADYVPSSPGGGGRLSIISDPTNPGSSANVAQLLFPAGFGSGSAPESMYPTANPYTPQPKQLYVHFFIKLSSNWYGNTTAGINKILFVTFGVGGQDPVGSAVIEFAAMGGIDGTEQTLQPSVSPEGVISMNGQPGPSFTLGVNKVPYTTASQVTRGAWHRFEALITINTPGLQDGGVKWWWDGTLYGDYSNTMRWSGDGAGLFQNVVWSPTYGGGAGQTIQADQYMYMKDLYISGK